MDDQTGLMTVMCSEMIYHYAMGCDRHGSSQARSDPLAAEIAEELYGEMEGYSDEEDSDDDDDEDDDEGKRWFNDILVLNVNIEFIYHCTFYEIILFSKIS